MVLCNLASIGARCAPSLRQKSNHKDPPGATGWRTATGRSCTQRVRGQVRAFSCARMSGLPMSDASPARPIRRTSSVDQPELQGPALAFFRRYLGRSHARIPDAALADEARLVFPSVCSIFDDPESELEIAVKIAQAAIAGAKKLWFDQTRSTQVDLCAEALTAALAKEARAAHIYVDGDYPHAPDARSCVAGFGTPAVLKEFAYERTWDIALIPLERHTTGSSASGSLPLEEPAIRAERIPVLIERQFGNFVMKREFADRLAQFVSAAAENAAEHGGSNWWVACSFRKLSDAAVGKCQIVIFDVGDTIFESMQRLPGNAPMRSLCESAIAEHRRKVHPVGGWTEESLWTLLALENTATRFSGKAYRGKGIGTLAMLRFLDLAAETSPPKLAPRMCILSGRTHVLFDSRYQSSEVSEGFRIARGPKLAADSHLTRTPARVQTLRHFFPGTLVAAHFYVSADEHLQPAPATDEELSEERRPESGPAYAVSSSSVLRL
jgi:hypothetical protein